MALELNGDTGVSLVQDGVVTAGDLASTLDLTGKTVTLPSGTGGKVLQVAHEIYGTPMGTTSTTAVAANPAVSITSVSANSKFLVQLCSTPMINESANEKIVISIRSSLDSYASALVQKSLYQSQGGWHSFDGSLIVLHSPNQAAGTTITYRPYFASGGTATVYIGDTWTTGDNSITSITIMEIAA